MDEPLNDNQTHWANQPSPDPKMMEPSPLRELLRKYMASRSSMVQGGGDGGGLSLKLLFHHLLNGGMGRGMGSSLPPSTPTLSGASGGNNYTF